MAYNPGQPRHPAGSDKGGEWASIGPKSSKRVIDWTEDDIADLERQLTDIRQKHEAAKARFTEASRHYDPLNPKSRHRRAAYRSAGDDMEFWGSKRDMLSRLLEQAYRESP